MTDEHPGNTTSADPNVTRCRALAVSILTLAAGRGDQHDIAELAAMILETLDTPALPLNEYLRRLRG